MGTHLETDTNILDSCIHVSYLRKNSINNYVNKLHKKHMTFKEQYIRLVESETRNFVHLANVVSERLVDTVNIM